MIAEIIQNCNENNHRAIFVLKNTAKIHEIYAEICLHANGPRPMLLQLFKSRAEEIKIDFPEFIETVKFTESGKILGNTFGMLVVQDFVEVSPNLLAQSVETVKGGGVVCFIVNTDCNYLENNIFGRRLFQTLAKANSVFFSDENNVLIQSKKKNRKTSKTSCCDSTKQKQLIKGPSKDSETDENIAMKKIKISDVKLDKSVSMEFSNFDSNTGKITDCENTLTIDKSENGCNGIGISNQTTLQDSIEEGVRQKLYSLSKTTDQYEVLSSFTKVLSERSFKTVCSLTAARGRGKSAVLGLSVALSLHCSFSTIMIAAPCIENVKTVFEFICIGLEALGYQNKVHFDIYHKSKNRKRYTFKITFRKRFLRQEVVYFDPADDLTILPDLMVIDEAASIPLPRLNKLLQAKMVLMASTIGGYEGTGRVLALKLFTELERRSKDRNNPFVFHKMSLNIPIRYALHDPIEEWLSKSLFLYSKNTEIEVCPEINKCGLYLVNKNLLFGFTKTSEQFLNQIVGLFGAAHYKNSPDDLLSLANNPQMQIFVLCSQIDKDNPVLPTILCALQVVSERIVDNSKAGNLTPHCLYENYHCKDALSLNGLRIVRIAVHPDAQRMGYGSAAVYSLKKHISKCLPLPNSNTGAHNRFSNAEFTKNECTNVKKPQIEAKSQIDNLPIHSAEYSASEMKQKDAFFDAQKHEKSLLVPLCDFIIDRNISYLSASFGATSDLIAFWKKNEFRIMHLKAHPSDVTGEYSALFIHPFDNQHLFSRYNSLFRQKYVFSLSSFHKSLQHVLALDIFYNTSTLIEYDALRYKTELDASDINMLLLFIQGKTEYRHIVHLIQILSRNYFLGHIKAVLSPLEQCIALLLGLQMKRFEDLREVLDVESYKVDSKLLSAVTKLYEALIISK